MTKEEARQEIARLVTKYQSLDSKAIKTFTEADTRRTFIEPLFQALGWDVYSRDEVAEEAYASANYEERTQKLAGNA